MLTVVLATYNGAGTLQATLGSFEKLEAPAMGWKLIVVDNASTDTTPAILNAFRDRLPLTLLHQPKRGKNRALNLAIPEFAGDLIVFTDDDIIAPPDWLLLFEALAAAKPECAVFGGRIVPRWPMPDAQWRASHIPTAPAFAVHPQDIEDGPINPRMIWGPNMAIRHSVFKEGIRFDETVGPAAGEYPMGSETELTHRLRESGYGNWFSNRIIVEHQIRPEQLTAHWLARRARLFAKQPSSRIIVQGYRPPRRIFGVEGWRIRVLLKYALQRLWATLRRDEPRQWEALWYINFHITVIRKERNRERSERKTPLISPTSSRRS